MHNSHQYLAVVQRAFDVLKGWGFESCMDLTKPGVFFDFESYSGYEDHPKHGNGRWCFTVTYEVEANTWFGTKWFEKKGAQQYQEQISKGTVKNVLLAVMESGYLDHQFRDVPNSLRTCAFCADSPVPGKIVSNPEWPNGDLPYFTSCEACSGCGEIEDGN